ncbi:MAG: hypothetical protein INQ03_03240 [Candidatus Heimdallarchaeota archaeon]|nr:hypothetical protein [Candidatus Heimdallarchaeota archaeon]
MLKIRFLMIVLIFSSIHVVSAELFTPTLDGAKGAGEYTKANSYQITFTDIDTQEQETGTLYVGRDTSDYHLALEIDYPATDELGAIAFAITIAEKDPSDTQIMDRKIAMYSYNYTTSSWISQFADQNEKQDTKEVQNETIDGVSASNIIGDKSFFEMSIPFSPSDSEPYDRHLDSNEEVIVVFTHYRAYYDAEDNTLFGFHAISDAFYFMIQTDSVALELDSERINTEEIGLGLFFFVAIPITVIMKKLKS